MAKSQRDSQLLSAADVIQALLGKSSAVGDQFTRWNLERTWKDVVGPTLGAVSRPIRYREGTLYVAAKSSAWIHQLSFALEPLKEKLNSHLGRNWVKSIRLEVGPV